MTKEEQLKSCILEKYKSIRAFCMEIGFPYSTLDSAMKRGIDGAGVSGMIKVFDALDLDIESISEETLRRKEKLIGESKKAITVDSDSLSENDIQLLKMLHTMSNAEKHFLACLMQTMIDMRE